MSTYLLIWDPTKSPFYELSDLSGKVKNGNSVNFPWSCGSTKRIKKDDRVFLIRLGKYPKGIFGAGKVI